MCFAAPERNGHTKTNIGTIAKVGIHPCAACGKSAIKIRHKIPIAHWLAQLFMRRSPGRSMAGNPTANASGIFLEEVKCARCGYHLGHVLSFGPPPTHLRYCLNSVASEIRKGGRIDNPPTP